MTLEILAIDYDSRIRTHVATARTTYGWYLDAINHLATDLRIQRDIIRSKKAYQTLRADLRRGCVLPPIVLAASGLTIPFRLEADTKVGRGELEDLSTVMAARKFDEIQIIDGLQRTNAIWQTAEELSDVDRPSFLDQPLRVEFWLNIGFFSLAYRMLLLNAGQRPMSMKHQLEILSGNLASELSDIPHLDIIRTGDNRRRVHAGQYQLSKLSQAFQAWLQGQPSVDTQNIIAEQLLSDNAIEVLGGDISVGQKSNDDEIDFRDLVSWIVRMDRQVGDNHLQFFGSETVLQGIAAAVGRAHRTESLRPRLKEALLSLESNQDKDEAASNLGIEMFDQFRRGIDPKKRNVGEATRDLVFRAFQEYLYTAGTKEMSECWTFAASAL